ncbi:hypothetical protein N431DRAFT_408305 [Stipitochalara longipes BDJ]|nr:hypothetical protein N431DRAFT_408305 [Stipitochalara longipes BDJ]
MDQLKHFLKDDESVIFTRKVAVWAAFAIFALESCINFRQARLQDCQREQTAAAGDWNNGVLHRPQDVQRARTQVIFRTMTAGHFLLLVLLVVQTNAAPGLWVLVGDFQAAFLPSFTNELWRSCLFLFVCLFIYLALNLPNYIFRSMILNEDVTAHFTARCQSTWSLHDLAGDNVMPTVLLFVTISVLLYQVFGVQFNRSYVPVFAASQLVFCFVYPIVSQPKKNQLSLLEPGSLNDEIHQLAVRAKLKLSNICISTGPLPKDIEEGVRTLGWPRMKHLSIHESIFEQCSDDEIKALTAQKLGGWLYGNSIRAFVVSNITITHVFSMVMLFTRQKAAYAQWNFPAEVYPTIAGIVIYSIGFAPISWAWFTLQMHVMHRKNVFMADKFAATHGYSLELSRALSKIPGMASEMKIDWIYSLYHNSTPQISERLEALEKLRKDDEGAISLPTAMDEKV